MNKENRTVWGLVLVIVGIAFLLRQMGVLPYGIESILFDFRNLFILIGAIYLLMDKNKNTGIILFVLGVVLYFNEIISWTQNLSNFIWPMLLILAGVLLLSGSGVRNKLFKRKKK